MWRMRPFEPTEEEYAAIVGVYNTIWRGEWLSVEQVRHYDRVRDKQLFFRRMVIEQDDQIIGTATYGEPAWSLAPGKYHVEIEIHPTYERRGIGSACYEYIMQQLQARDVKPVHYTAETREDKAQAIRFLEQRGFRQVMRSPGSVLDVTTFDASRYVGVIGRVVAGGIAIRTMRELAATDPAWQHKLYDLDWECTLDEPLPNPPTRRPFEEYAERVFDSPVFLPDGSFVAVDGDQYVGVSALRRTPGDPARLNTSFTGVRRSHRRRGIATALKLRAIEFAKAHGAQTIHTDNEENNPMYQINLKLGFTPKPAWLDFEKVLT